MTDNPTQKKKGKIYRQKNKKDQQRPDIFPHEVAEELGEDFDFTIPDLDPEIEEESEKDETIILPRRDEEHS